MKKLSFILSVLFICSAQAKKFKLAILAPEGTTYATTLKKMAKEIKKATDGRVKLKIYFGGVQGDEPDVLRKVRVGQLDGGIFTGKTLGDIHGDIRAMEIPFNFNKDRKKAYKTLNNLAPFFNKRLKSKQFESLGFYEIGQVYIVSTKKIESLAGFSGNKIWLWDGDALVERLVGQMKLVAVPLSLPDVLSSLSTGIINSAYAPPLGIMALQWQTKVKYLIDFPVAYSIGALLLSSKAWKKIKAADQVIVKALAKKYINEASIASVGENNEALAAFKKLGIKFVSFPEADLAKGSKIRENVIKALTGKGKLFSQEVITLLNKEIK
jgi:TRAP-type transport system periplasmic protein